MSGIVSPGYRAMIDDHKRIEDRVNTVEKNAISRSVPNLEIPRKDLVARRSSRIQPLFARPRITSVVVVAFALALSLGGVDAASAQPGAAIGLDGKCMDVLGSGTTEGTAVVLFECTGNPNQQWSAERVFAEGQELVRFRGLADQCLQSAGAASSLTPAVMGPCEDPESLFSLSGWFPEYFALIQRSSGLCVDVLGSSSDNLTPLVFFECTGALNQNWRFLRSIIGGPPVAQAGDVLGVGGQCLDVLGGGTTEGTPVVMFGCTGNANQEWTFESSFGRLRIRGRAGLCLRPGGVGDSGFDELVIGACDEGAVWDLATAGAAPSFGLLHADSGQCLDVLGASTDPLTPTILFRCTGNANQAWNFEARAVPGRCIPSTGRLCLNDGRFAVEAEWRDFRDRTGRGTAVPLDSTDSGLMWFFNSNNLEVLVKVLDACSGPTNRFWVFAAATTNVEYTLRVMDMMTGEERIYVNPLGSSADAITDTMAFATCP